MGGTAIGYWRRRAILLSLEVRNYQLSLKNMIATKTKELELKNKELKTLSFTDSLTGLYNRRFFDRMLEKEWNKSSKDEKSLSLIMFDIDRFKQYNVVLFCQILLMKMHLLLLKIFVNLFKIYIFFTLLQTLVLSLLLV